MCLALNVYYESNNQPELGQKLVAQTTINRSIENNSSICEEVLRPNQFSWVSQNVHRKRLKKSIEPQEGEQWENAQRIAKLALNSKLSLPKTLATATSFHANNVKPRWSKSKDMRCLGKIGNHTFYSKKK